MIDKNEFRQNVLKQTLALVDKPYAEWTTHNNKLNSIVFLKDEHCKFEDELNTNELPLLECVLTNSYVLITTDRVISILDDKRTEMKFENMARFGNEFENENHLSADGKMPKTNRVVIYNNENGRLVFVVDSLYPAYFSKVLIHNLISFRVKGKFAW